MKSVRALIIDDASDLITFAEQSPDTVITLLNGEKILVQEPVRDIVSRIIEFRCRVLSGLGTWTQAPVAMAFGPETPPNENEG